MQNLKLKKSLFKFLTLTKLIILLSLVGCSGHYFEKSADKEVNKILNKEKVKVKGEKLPKQTFLEEETSPETIFLTLKDTLILAAKNNRDYQSKKEDLYLKVLDLTYQRYLYRTRYNLTGEIFWERNDTENVNANLNLNLIQWLTEGTQITFDITKNFIKYLTGSKEKAYQTFLSLDLLQPIFKGAGKKIAQENLIQAERNVVYEIRSFLRYQKSFSVDTTNKFFNILLLKNNLDNYWSNYIFLKDAIKRMQMLAEAGRVSTLEVNQMKQNEYQAYQRWINAYNSYLSAFDEFKIFLGFSPEKNISIYEKSLEKFFTKDIPEIKIDIQKSINDGLEKRLDLITSYDEIYDAEREVKIALNNLKTKLDLNISVESSTPEKTEPTFEFQQPDYMAGFDFELPFNKIPERNAYKTSLIQLERAKRNFSLKKDEVKEEILNSYRTLQEAYQSYLVQKNSLELATKRVKSADLFLQAGRATTRDLLEAQEAFLSAKNSLSNAIVNYLISYLNFLKNTESLQLNEKGVWEGDIYEKIFAEDYQE